MLRRYPDATMKQWNIVFSANTRLLVGPITYFLEQLCQIGWSPLADATVVDHNGVCWDIVCNSITDIEVSLQDAWVWSIILLIS